MTTCTIVWYTYTILLSYTLLLQLQLISNNKTSWTTTHAAAATTNTGYVPVTALDEYGQSSQLRNALKASKKHGKLILAAKANDHSGIVVCSTAVRVRCKDCNNDFVEGGGGGGDSLIQVIAAATGDDSGTSDTALCACSCTALVCSGLRADAVLLIQLLRDYTRRVWDYYDIVADAGRVAEALAEILLSCMNYDTNDTLVDGAGPVIADNEFSMSRPFGVSSFVLGTRSTAANPSTANLISVDPSGVQEEWVANAMGRSSDKAQKLLEKRWSAEMTLEEVQDICVSIVRQLQIEEGGDAVSDTSIVCETLTTCTGIVSRQIFPILRTKIVTEDD